MKKNCEQKPPIIIEGLDPKVLRSRRCVQLWQETKSLWRSILNLDKYSAKIKTPQPMKNLRIQHDGRHLQGIDFFIDPNDKEIKGLFSKDTNSATLVMSRPKSYAFEFTLRTTIFDDHNHQLFRGVEDKIVMRKEGAEKNGIVVCLCYYPENSWDYFSIAGKFKKPHPRSLVAKDGTFPNSQERMDQINYALNNFAPLIKIIERYLAINLAQTLDKNKPKRIHLTMEKSPSVENEEDQFAAPFSIYQPVVNTP